MDKWLAMNVQMKGATLLLALYGLLLLLKGATDMAEVEATEGFLSFVLRLATVAAVVWGLVQMRRWAWWAAIVLTGLWTLAAAVGGGLLYLSGAIPKLPYWYTGYYFLLVLTVGASFGLLLSSGGRAPLKAVNT